MLSTIPLSEGPASKTDLSGYIHQTYILCAEIALLAGIPELLTGPCLRLRNYKELRVTTG